VLLVRPAPPLPQPLVAGDWARRVRAPTLQAPAGTWTMSVWPLGMLLLSSVTSASESKPVASLNRPTYASAATVLASFKRKPVWGDIWFALLLGVRRKHD
jgi:hypothetical protein